MTYLTKADRDAAEIHAILDRPARRRNPRASHYIIPWKWTGDELKRLRMFREEPGTSTLIRTRR